jgi:hypothetical protein
MMQGGADSCETSLERELSISKYFLLNWFDNPANIDIFMLGIEQM